MDNKFIKKYLLLFLCIFLIGCATIPPVQRGSISRKTLHDGIFTADYTKWPVKAVVEVEIKNNKILSVNLVNHRNMKGAGAEAFIPDRIVQSQSTDVDVVSGATYSSIAIMNAAQRAIDLSAETEE